MRRNQFASNNWLRAAVLAGAASIAIAVTAPGIVVAAGERALELMRKSMSARGRVAYQATAQIAARNRDGEAQRWSQIIYRDLGDRERVKILDHEGTLVWLRVCDGKTRLEHNLRKGSVRESRPMDSKNRRARDERALEILAGNFDLAIEGAEVVAGRRTYRVSISDPGPPKATIRRLWIDQQTHLELKTVVYGEDERPAHSVSIERIVLNPRFDAKLFRYDPPPTVTPNQIAPPLFTGVMQAAADKAGLEANPPPKLPQGFAMLKNLVGVREHKGHPVLWYQHTDGIRWFSVFQRRVAPEEAPKEPSLKRFSVGEFQMTVIGSLSAEELKMIRDGYTQQH